MSTAIATKNGGIVAPQTSGKLRDWIGLPEIKQDLTAALGGWMDGEAYISNLLISFSDAALADCTDKSKFREIHKCAALALLPSAQHIALIPRNMKQPKKKKTDPDKWEREVTTMVQWQGYDSLMRRNSEVLDIHVDLVLHGDDFEWRASENVLIHEYDPFSDRQVDAGLENLRGGYMRIDYRDGRLPKYHFIGREEILKRKNCADAGPIWKTWTKEQCRKTVYRDAYARRVLPLDPLVNIAMQKAVEHDDQTLGNDPSRVVVVQQGQSRSEQVAKLLQGRKQPPVEIPQETIETLDPREGATQEEPESSTEEATDASKPDSETEQEASKDAAVGGDVGYDTDAFWRHFRSVAGLTKIGDVKKARGWLDIEAKRLDLGDEVQLQIAEQCDAKETEIRGHRGEASNKQGNLLND